MTLTLLISGLVVLVLGGLAFSGRLRELMVWRSRRVSATDGEDESDGMR
jgi:hypothetical protein